MVLTLVLSYIQVKKQIDAADTRSSRELNAAEARAREEREAARQRASQDRMHSTDEARTERLASVRREVYVEAVSEVTKAHMFIAGLPTEDLENLDYSASLGGFASAISRVAIVGETRTVLLARELSKLMNKRLMKSMVELIPLSAVNGELKVHVAEKLAAQTEVARILAAMTNHNETRKGDPEGFAALQRSSAAQQERFKRHADAEAAARNSIVAIRQRYADSLQDFIGEVMTQLDQLVFSVREELELETDEEALKTQTAQMRVEALAAFAELKARVAAHIANTESAARQ